MAEHKISPPRDTECSDELVVIGKHTERNEMEEFWMEKLTLLEKQYDEHMIRLQKSVFDYRVNAALVRKKEEQMQEMRKKLEENKMFNEKLLEEKEKLSKKLTSAAYEVKIIN